MAPAPPPPAVVAVSWNTRELLDACLRSRRANAEEGRADVWVVDDGASDASVELVREEHPWATLVASQAGAIAPRLLLPDRSVQHSAFAFSAIAFTAIHNLGVAPLVPGLDERLCLPGTWDPERLRETDWAMGAFLLVRREAWEAAGGFDAGQWMYAEDLDLGWRLARAGRPTRHQPAARVHDRASATTEQARADASTERWLAATYAWSVRRRGALATRAVAVVQVLGAAVRCALRVPLARARPERSSAGRDWCRGRARLHSVGLRPRARLERGGRP